jgi:uncharacterized protein (TIGR02996 family)
VALLDRVTNLNPAEAVDLLVREWGKARSNAVADLVDAFASRIAVPAFDGSPSAWVTAAKKAKPHERGALLRAIQGRTTSDTVKMLKTAVTWEDPRLTHAIHDLLVAMPWSGARSRGTWHEVFDVLARHADPRWLAIAPTLPAMWSVGRPLQTWLTRQLESATSALHVVTVSDEAELAAFARELIASAPKQDKRSGTELLAAVYRNPDADEERLVYADWLMEQGDPRGEFIACQFKADPDSKKRSRALLREHKKAWLGPLANVLRGDVEFRRGFPAQGIATFRHERDVAQWGSVVDWATLEELSYSHTLVRDDQREWAHFIGPAMKSLRVAHCPTVAHLCAASTPWRIHTLALADAKDIALVTSSPLLPELTTLELRDWRATPAALATAKCPHFVIVRRPDDDTAGAWMSAATRASFESFAFQEWHGTRYTFSRDEKGALTRLHVVVRPRAMVRKLDPSSNELKAVAQTLSRVKGRFTHFEAEMEVAGELVPAPSLATAIGG